MRIAYSCYLLKGKNLFGNRQGALLQVTFPDKIIGYADCHPWTELGDAPLKSQLAGLKDKRQTPLTKRSLYFARIDALARAKGQNLFANLTIPKSHWLMHHETVPEAYTHLKFKDPYLLLEVLPKIDSDKKIRFDPNAKFTLSECREFLEKIQPWKERFDYIEDPFPFAAQEWKKMEKQYHVKFALDRNPENLHYPFTVVKPAVQDPSGASASKRQIVTSYLDHPFGQLTAAYTAALLCPDEVCGLLSHQVYHPNPWSRQLNILDQRLIPPDGTGFGFNSLLNEQHWERLVHD